MSGIFGLITKGNCAEDLFYGTNYHSHLGTQFAGLAVWGSNGLSRKIHDISGSQFKAKFHEDYPKMEGNRGIGVISAYEEQPIVINSKFGPFAIATNGFIENANALAQELYREGKSFSEFGERGVNLTELVAKFIISGQTIPDGIARVSKKIRGSCSLLLLSREGIYVARDRNGYTPLVVGQRGQDWAVTTESASFTNLGFKVKKYLGPGEIILLDGKKMESKQRANKTNQICSFLWIYTGFPASSYEGISVEEVRERCGRCLARQDKIKADIVCGIPDSGTTHAIGYACASKVEFHRPLVKYNPGFDRSYTPPSQEVRDRIAKMKLIPIPEIIKGRRIVVCDDSIVRGTQFKNYTIQKLWDYGAKEIHLRIACPPLVFPCKFNYSTRSIQELAARKAIRSIEGRDIEDISAYLNEESAKYKQMVSWVTKDLGVTTLKYQRLADMVRAIGLPAEKLCLYCWTGKGL